jgi:zinc-finger of a C2HC-type
MVNRVDKGIRRSFMSMIAVFCPILFTRVCYFCLPTNMDIQDRKSLILLRLNHKVRVRNLLKYPSPDAFKLPPDSRQEIENLKRRIKELETGQSINENNRFDKHIDTGALDGRILKNAHENTNATNARRTNQAPKPKSPPIASKGSYDIASALNNHPDAERKRLSFASSKSSLVKSSSIESSNNSIAKQPNVRKIENVKSISKNIIVASKSKNTIAKNTQSLLEKDPSMKLVKCSNCNRSFRQERIDTHQNVCINQKKRPVFDEEKMRMKGTELETFRKPTGGYDKIKGAKVKAGKDKNGNSILLITATGKPSKNENAPKPSRAEKQQLVPCDHCGRNFSEGSIEKHQDICQKISAKPKRSVFGVKRV